MHVIYFVLKGYSQWKTGYNWHYQGHQQGIFVWVSLLCIHNSTTICSGVMQIMQSRSGYDQLECGCRQSHRTTWGRLSTPLSCSEILRRRQSLGGCKILQSDKMVSIVPSPDRSWAYREEWFQIGAEAGDSAWYRKERKDVVGPVTTIIQVPVRRGLNQYISLYWCWSNAYQVFPPRLKFDATGVGDPLEE